MLFSDQFQNADDTHFLWISSKYFSNLDVVLTSADGEEIFKPYQFKMEEIEGLRYRSKVSNVSLVYLRLEIYII